MVSVVTKSGQAPLRILPLIAAMIVSGCAVGPNYSRPESTLPGNYTEAGAAAEQPAPFIEQAWWTQFQDPILNQLVDKALDENADVRIAIARVEQAEAAAREAGAALLPEVDARANSSRSRLSGATAAGPDMPTYVTSHSAALSTSYELDVWGRVRRSGEAARARAFASHYSKDSIRLTIAGLVASNYLTLRALDAQLTLSDESEASRESTLRLVRSRVDAGLVSPLDLYQAQGALASIQAQTAQLRRQRALTRNQLALLTGTPGLQIPSGDLRQLPMPPVPPAGLPSSLVRARPDVRQAEANLVAANAGIGIARAGYFPRFTLTGSIGTESDTFSELFTADAGTGLLGLGMLMPLLDFGRTSARVDQAEALERQSVAAYQRTLQNAFREVNDAIVNLRENAAAEDAQTARAEAAEKALDLAQIRYQAGQSGYLEVLDAQRSSNDALLAFVSTRSARLTAAVDLFKALGGGWKDQFVTAENTSAGRKL